MEPPSSGSLITTIAAVAIASGATAALATVLALNMAGHRWVDQRAWKWSKWMGLSNEGNRKGHSTSHCCCNHESPSPVFPAEPKSSWEQQAKEQPAECPTFREQDSLQDDHRAHSPKHELYVKPSTDFSMSSTSFPKQLDKLLEEAGTPEDASQQVVDGHAPLETPSIDLRTPEKQPRTLDASLGGMSPALPGKPDPEDPTKRRGYLSWDDYFMAVAFLSAQRSKDPNRQVGACIVSQERIILGIGYNGFPRGCSDDQLPWAKASKDGDLLKTKYPYVCHAELNAILNRNHASAPGQKMYVTMYPCNECAKLIIQSGISEVIYYTDKGGHERDIGPGDPRPEVAYAASKRLLKMAGVKLCQHKPAKASITLDFR